MPQSHGIGLGKIILRSALNEPLDAVVELLQVEGVDISQLSIAFGNPRNTRINSSLPQSYLDGMQFSISGSVAGGYWINVTSREAVVEPYLNFVLEMQYILGTIAREYVLLLDPKGLQPKMPTLVSGGSPASPQPVTQPISANGELSNESSVTSRYVAPAARRSDPIDVSEPYEPSFGSDYVIRSGDTLWEIAKSAWTPTGDSNLFQVMLSIHQNNTNAFVNNNIALLRTGQSIKIPTLDEVRQQDRISAQQVFQRWTEISEARIVAARQGQALPSFDEVESKSQVQIQNSEPDSSPSQEEPAVAPRATEPTAGFLTLLEPSPEDVAADAAAVEERREIAAMLSREGLIVAETARLQLQDQISALYEKLDLVSIELANTQEVLARNNENLLALQAAQTQQGTLPGTAAALVAQQRTVGELLLGSWVNILVLVIALISFPALLVMGFLHARQNAMVALEPMPTSAEIEEFTANSPHLPHATQIPLEDEDLSAMELPKASPVEKFDQKLAFTPGEELDEVAVGEIPKAVDEPEIPEAQPGEDPTDSIDKNTVEFELKVEDDTPEESIYNTDSDISVLTEPSGTESVDAIDFEYELEVEDNTPEEPIYYPDSDIFVLIEPSGTESVDDIEIDFENELEVEEQTSEESIDHTDSDISVLTESSDIEVVVDR